MNISMSESNQSTNFIITINNISNELLANGPIIIFIFGIVGNCLNVFVLGQKTLRTNPSSVFFMVSSLAGIFVIISGLISRMMAGYNADLTLTVGWICKIRNFVLYSSRTVVLWMILSATIDRWLSSSIDVHRRQLSNMKNVRRCIIVIIVYAIVINTPYFYCYEANLSGTMRGCYGSTYACRTLTDLIYAIGTVQIPLVLMIVFGLLIIRNVHRMQQRIRHNVNAASINTTHHSRATTLGNTSKRKMNQQLLKMLSLQITLLFLFACPHSIQKVYSSFGPSLPPQSVQYAIETLIFNIFTLLSFISSGMPFYIYTLAGGSLFRKAVVDLIKTTARRLLCCSCS